MSDPLLSADEVRFINTVAARRFDSNAVAVKVGSFDADAEGRPSARAASLAAALLSPGVLEHAVRPTVLLALCCQLRRDGLRLIAPQGVTAGMIRGLADGRVSETALVSWIDDRAVVE